MADDGWIDTGTDDGQGGAWKDTDDAPVTAGGVAAQVGRGAEAAPYSLLGAGIDLPYNAWNAAKDMYYGVTGTGPYAKGAKPDPSTQPQPSPVSNWLQTQGGKVSPQLDPRNYPAQNWPERIARSAGQTGTEALIGRAATTEVQAFTDPSAVPSAIKIGKQLAGSWFSGAGAGAGAETGRGAAQRAVDIDPDFRRLHPAIADMIENAGGIVGGVAGGYGASSVANRFGFPAGDPRADFTSDQLLKTAGNQYEIAKNIPANYTTPSISKFAFDHSQALLGNYGSSEIQPIITRLNKLMNTPAGAQSVPLKELTTLDDYLGTVVKKNTDNMGNVSKLGGAAADTQTAIRNFIKNPPQGSVHSGRPDLAAQYWNVADGNWAAGSRSQTLDLAKKQGERSGDLEGQVSKLTAPGSVDKKLYGFSDDEKEQLERFSQGSNLRSALGSGSRALSPHGGGLLSMPFMAYEGYEKGGIPGAIGLGLAPAAAGYAMHKGREALANRAFDRIAAQTRQRSPAYQNIPEDQRGASPFRTTIPVGLGALTGSGIWGQ